MLISAVGTKIYTHQGGSWQEEAAWVKLLAKGWEAQVARDAAYSALAKVRCCVAAVWLLRALAADKRLAKMLSHMCLPRVGKEVMHFLPTCCCPNASCLMPL